MKCLADWSIPDQILKKNDYTILYNIIQYIYIHTYIYMFSQRDNAPSNSAVTSYIKLMLFPWLVSPNWPLYRQTTSSWVTTWIGESKALRQFAACWPTRLDCHQLTASFCRNAGDDGSFFTASCFAVYIALCSLWMVMIFRAPWPICVLPHVSKGFIEYWID